jgi:predicted DNA-binding transcriptional regulator AlpA
MTSVASGVARKKVKLSAILMKISMLFIIGVAVYWLGLNLFKDPIQFASVTVNGLTNGMLYALIAEGKFPNGFALTKGGRARGWLESSIDDHLVNLANKEA